MKLLISHTTLYQYAVSAYGSFSQAWLHPANDDRQTVVAFSLAVEPSATIESKLDFFGNRVHTLHVPGRHRQLWVNAASTVITRERPLPNPVTIGQLQAVRDEHYEFVQSTGRVPLDPELLGQLGAPQPDAADDLLGYLLELTRYAQRRFTYDPNSTTVDASLAEFLATGRGVCQDYAHAMLAVLRANGLAARYVSGYIPTDGPGQSHAWAEVLFPGGGWVGFDATAGLMIGEQYVKVAHGKDYDDCPPLKGVHLGGGAETLSVVVQVTEG